MTCYLDGMNFPLPKGTPKQQLVMQEFKKIAVNFHFILNHCFPARIPPTGKGYAAVQNHCNHLKTSMEDILFELATSYRNMNPIRGILPGSPLSQQVELIANYDEINNQLETTNCNF